MLVLTLILWFNYKAPILPVYLWENPWKNLEMVAGPALVMGLGFAGFVARMVRSSLVEVIQEDYVKLFAQLIEPIFDRVIQTSNSQIYAHLQAALEKSMISCALKANRSNQVKTSEMLGISRNTLRDRMAKYELV